MTPSSPSTVAASTTRTRARKTSPGGGGGGEDTTTSGDDDRGAIGGNHHHSPGSSSSSTRRRRRRRRRWRETFGCNVEALALYRITLGTLLLLELALRFRYLHPFYSDEGTLPLRLLLPKIDPLYRIVCVHCHSGSMMYQRCLLSIQLIFALSFLVGYRTRMAAFGSWFLYLSLTLRNTWLAFILDRYFHYLLFYAMFLPTSRVWSVDAYLRGREGRRRGGGGGGGTTTASQGGQNDDDDDDDDEVVLSLATIALKLQVVWIYLDAGGGKLLDEKGGWSYYADPLSALDTYARHTVGARYMYGLLGPTGLRVMTPLVVWVELLAAPVALLGSYMGWDGIVGLAVFLICKLHVGIALTINNAVLLSLVACSAWCVFLPKRSGILRLMDRYFLGGMGGSDGGRPSNAKGDVSKSDGVGAKSSSSVGRIGVGAILIPLFVLGSIWFEALSDECDQSTKHIWSTMFHNRWNVFVGAEEYVTWEIAPGRLEDGSVVDVWARTDDVNWDMPGAGAPCTSTARAGRWRSFPYLAGLDGEDGEALWDYLCREWNVRNGVVLRDDDASPHPHPRRLLRFNFFMLQADVLPNMAFSATRKRLIHSHECGTVVEERYDGDDDNTAEREGAQSSEL